MSERLNTVKNIIKENYDDGKCGIFNMRNLVGDIMTTIYDEDGVTVDICYNYSYFEVFGLSNKEFEELEKYYEMLGGRK